MQDVIDCVGPIGIRADELNPPARKDIPYV